MERAVRRPSFLMAALLLATPVNAELTSRQIAAAGTNPPVGATLPSSLVFEEGSGRRVTLGGIAGGKPLILLFVDYTCRNICGPGLTLSAQAMDASGLIIGRDYEFAIVGMDPRDGPGQAQAMRIARLSAMPSIERASHFLVGSPGTISAASAALGYRAVYDPSTDQFAHDASAFVFGGDGRLAAVLPELALSPQMVRRTIRQSDRVDYVDGVAAGVARICYGFAAAHGIYGGAVVWGMRTLAVALLAALGLAIHRMQKRRRRAIG